MMSRIAAVVLAAGYSSRFGANKLLQLFRGKPLVRYAVEAATASKAEPVIVVTGNDSRLVKDMLAKMPVELVDNFDFSTGLSSSLKSGLRNVPADADGAIILLGDMPLIRPSTIDRLIDVFSLSSFQGVVVPIYHGRRGNPVLWSRRFFPGILALEGDRGAKPLLTKYAELIYELEVDDPGVHIDIDTPEDFARYE